MSLVRAIHPGPCEGATRNSRRGRRVFQGARILALLVGLLAPALYACGDGEVAVAKEPAADFTLKLFDGGNFRLSEQRGSPVIINFFASWCTLCGFEVSGLENVYREYAGRKVRIVGVAIEDTEAKARQHVKKFGLSFPTGLDAEGTVKKAYGVYGLPMTYLIDRNGFVHYVHAGAITEELLRFELEKIL